MKTRSSSPWKNLRKYYAIGRISLQTTLAYPVNQLSEFGYYSLLFCLLFFFQQATLQQAQQNQTEGLSLAQIMWIIFFVNIFEQRSKGVSYVLNQEIQSGQLAYRLNRPCSYMLFYYAEYLGERIASLIFSGITSGLMIYYLVGAPPTSIATLILGILMLFIGATISFFLQFCIGLCAFWIEGVDPLRWIYWQAQSVLGGAVIPLALFPQTIKKMVAFLPFANTFYGAAHLIVNFNLQNFQYYITLQLFWLFAVIVLARTLFKKGVKNVVISGG